MDLKQYVQDAIRTESRIDSIKTDYPDLDAIMRIFVAAGNMLDDIKKNVFYGKEIDPTKWDNNLLIIKDASTDIFQGKFVQLERKEELQIDPRLFHAIIGIATESTELVEAVIKAMANEVDIDHVNVREELGDLNWYQAIAVDSTDADWEEILITNIEKLKKRYPEKFTTDHAINRDLHAERSILEGNHNGGKKS